jgi:hypothetical protein
MLLQVTSEPGIPLKMPGYSKCNASNLFVFFELRATFSQGQIVRDTVRKMPSEKAKRKSRAKGSGSVAAGQSKSPHTATDWRGAWTERLTALSGTHRLPRGFGGQPSV